MQKFLATALGLLLSLPATATDPLVVAPGRAVRIEYTALVDGRVVDASVDSGPVSFVVGAGTMMPGIEKALTGMAEGEMKTFDVAPADGYGEVDPGMQKEVPRSVLPPDLKPLPGMELEVRASGGDPLKAVVRSVAGERVVLDFNHPLAGRTLTFRVKVLAIAEAGAGEPAYPRAAPVRRTWPELLHITPAGVVYVARADRGGDAAELASLFSQIRQDADIALLQCGTQIVGVEIRGDILKTYSVLNGASRTTLRGLVEPASGRVSEERVLGALLAPYAGPEDHYRRPLACPLLLAPLADSDADLAGQLGRDICPRVTRLATCLEDLRAADARVAAAAGPGARKLYSGARWDSRIDYLDQLNPARR